MKKIRIIIGIICIMAGLGGIASFEILRGILTMLFGVSLIPNIYEEIKLDKIKYIQIIIPLVLLFVIGLVEESKVEPKTVSIPNISYIESNTEKQEENTIIPKIVDIENMTFNETEIELDIKETKNIELIVNPVDANKDSLTFLSTNSEILKAQRDFEKGVENKVFVKITPIAEGECEIYAISKDIQSNKIKVKIVDRERIENERKAEEERKRLEAEEQARKEEEARKLEEERKRQEEETRRIEEERKAAEQKAKEQSSSSSSKPQKETTSSKDDSRTVYITPTGKRYHYLSSCGGKNSTATTLSRALSLGLTPCQKCAK